MAAADTTKVKLPRSVVTELLPKVQANSVVAALSGAKPETFNDDETIIFTPSAEAEVVEEGAQKGSQGIVTSFVTGVRVKVQTTTRVTEELQWADEDDRLEIVKNIQMDQAGAVGRALDLVVLHGLNPAKKTALAAKYPHLTAATGVHVVTSTADELANLDAMADALIDWEADGVALSRKYASDLRKLRIPSTGSRLFPDIPMTFAVSSFEGLRASTSNTVDASKWAPSAAPTKVRAIMGDFDMLRWGMVRDMTAEVIPYGDPDGTGVDLKAHGQIAYRTQAVFAYGILAPDAFCVLKEATA